jgi:hypothetical protein
MRTEFIHSIEYIMPIVKDDYGNDFWLALVNTKKQSGYAHCSGYYVIAKNNSVNDGYKTYATEAFWKVKEKNLLLIESNGFYIEEYKERAHTMEWNPKSFTGYQSAPDELKFLVTRFYVRKNINTEL